MRICSARFMQRVLESLEINSLMYVGESKRYLTDFMLSQFHPTPKKLVLKKIKFHSLLNILDVRQPKPVNISLFTEILIPISRLPS